jgi:uncharacterized iron-regulated membrane protein
VPSALGKLWFEPRRSSLRYWMLQVHTWAGVGAGLYLAMMGLTGGLSVFLPELRNTLVPPIHASVGQQRMTLQTLQTSIQGSHPAFRLRAVYPGQSAARADTFEGASAIHYGQYGGVPTRVFAVLLGLTLPLLYITGMALWWRRVSRRRPGAMVQAAPSVTLGVDDVYAFETQ